MEVPNVKFHRNCSVGAVLIHVDRRIDRHDEANRRSVTVQIHLKISAQYSLVRVVSILEPVLVPSQQLEHNKTVTNLGWCVPLSEHGLYVAVLVCPVHVYIIKSRS